jgi:hypothetical protein
MCCLSAVLKTRPSGVSSPCGCKVAERGFDEQDGYRSDHALTFVFGIASLGKAAVITKAKTYSTLSTSRAVPHPNTNRGLCR